MTENSNDAIKIEPVVQDGMEFYVDETGKRSGMSIRGLSRFIGVRQSTLQELISKIESSAELASEVLNPFSGKDLKVTGSFSQGAKIIESKVCEAITFYYVFESVKISKEVKDQATKAYRKFALKGLHSYICEIVGFIEQNDVKELKNMMQYLISEMGELKKETYEYRAIRNRTQTSFIGLDKMLDNIVLEPNLLMPGEDGYISLEGWLETKGITLTVGKMRGFGRMVSETYKSIVKKDPLKKNFLMEDGTKKYNVSVYREEHYPILQMCLDKFICL